jgi:hypothetical protein
MAKFPTFDNNIIIANETVSNSVILTKFLKKLSDSSEKIQNLQNGNIVHRDFV